MVSVPGELHLCLSSQYTRDLGPNPWLFAATAGDGMGGHLATPTAAQAKPTARKRECGLQSGGNDRLKYLSISNLRLSGPGFNHPPRKLAVPGRFWHGEWHEKA